MNEYWAYSKEQILKELDVCAQRGLSSSEAKKRLNLLGQRLIWLTLMIAAVVAAVGIVAGKEIYLMVETSIVLAVAAIPEAREESFDPDVKMMATSTIVSSVAQGRVIFHNIRKFMLYLLSCNLGALLTVGIASGVNLPLPVLPLQILFLNLVTDVFPALALGLGEGKEDLWNLETFLVSRIPPRLTLVFSCDISSNPEISPPLRVRPDSLK